MTTAAAHRTTWGQLCGPTRENGGRAVDRTPPRHRRRRVVHRRAGLWDPSCTAPGYAKSGSKQRRWQLSTVSTDAMDTTEPSEGSGPTNVNHTMVLGTTRGGLALGLRLRLHRSDALPVQAVGPACKDLPAGAGRAFGGAQS